MSFILTDQSNSSLLAPQAFFVSDLFKPKGRRSTLLPIPVIPVKDLVPPADIRDRGNLIMA